MKILLALFVLLSLSLSTKAEEIYQSTKCIGEIKPGYLDPSSYSGVSGLNIIDELSKDYSIDLKNIKSSQKIFDDVCNVTNNHDEDGNFYTKDNFSISIKHLINCQDGSKGCFYHLTISQNITSNGKKFAQIHFNGSRIYKRTQWYLGDDFEVKNWVRYEISDKSYNSCFENNAFNFCILID